MRNKKIMKAAFLAIGMALLLSGKNAGGLSYAAMPEESSEVYTALTGKTEESSEAYEVLTEESSEGYAAMPEESGLSYEAMPEESSEAYEALTEGNGEEIGNNASASASAGATDQELRDLKPVTKDDVDIEYNLYYDYDEGNLNLDITKGNDAVKNVHFLLFLDFSEEGSDEKEYLYLGEDNNLNGDYDTGHFYDNFDGTWATIGDNVVTIEVIEETDQYVLYSIPCQIDGKETSIRALYDYEAGKYRILGRYDGIDNENRGSHMTSRGVRKIEDGSQVSFTFISLVGDDFEGNAYEMDPLTWSDDIVMEDTEMGEGTFLYMYEIEDVFGNEIDTLPVELTVENGEITFLTELD